ncbi:hypothetical protein E2C01_069725 [Portunus trituberculatus]|uniref:Uncharacterized protein n=1 Tax=Portunus trituberculatus TaxID=210409 RepID=A0A5B7I0C3_PORTR|nr:hypothetical protein [Portunus trituberculatus]
MKKIDVECLSSIAFYRGCPPLQVPPDSSPPPVLPALLSRPSVATGRGGKSQPEMTTSEVRVLKKSHKKLGLIDWEKPLLLNHNVFKETQLIKQ